MACCKGSEEDSQQAPTVVSVENVKDIWAEEESTRVFTGSPEASPRSDGEGDCPEDGSPGRTEGAKVVEEDEVKLSPAALAKEALLQAEALMKDYAVLEAEAILSAALSQLEELGEASVLDEFRASPTFLEVVDRVAQYDGACDMLTSNNMELLYESADGKFELFQPAGTGTWFEFRMTVNIEAPLSECLATGHELDLLQKAMPLVSEKPQSLSPPHRFLITALSKMSVVFFRVELLTETLRIRNAKHNFMTEVIRSSFPADGRKIPEKALGFRTIRPWVYTINLWMPRGGGEDGTVLVQVTRVDCTVNVPQWVLNKVFRHMAGAFMQDLRKSAAQARQPGSPWAERIVQDQTGLYRDCREIEENAQKREEITAQKMPRLDEMFARPWRLNPPPPDTRPPSSR